LRSDLCEVSSEGGGGRNLVAGMVELWAILGQSWITAITSPMITTFPHITGYVTMSKDLPTKYANTAITAAVAGIEPITTPAKRLAIALRRV